MFKIFRYKAVSLVLVGLLLALLFVPVFATASNQVAFDDSQTTTVFEVRAFQTGPTQMIACTPPSGSGGGCGGG